MITKQICVSSRVSKKINRRKKWQRKMWRWYLLISLNPETMMWGGGLNKGMSDDVGNFDNPPPLNNPSTTILPHINLHNLVLLFTNPLLYRSSYMSCFVPYCTQYTIVTYWPQIMEKTRIKLPQQLQVLTIFFVSNNSVRHTFCVNAFSINSIKLFFCRIG